MTKARTASKSKPKSKTQAQTRMFSNGFSGLPRPQVSPFFAAFAGVLAAVPLTIAVMMPLMHQDISSAVNQAAKTISMKPAADNLSCSQPTAVATSVGTTGTSRSGHVLGESTAQNSQPGGQGGGSQQTPPPFVKTIIGGNMTNTGTISGVIGAGATATVSSTQTETNNINNNTTITASSSNNQNISSGSASSSFNTNGGSANSGDVNGSNSFNVNFKVDNN